MADNNTNELDALMISELPTQATANETDLFEVAIVDANSASGYASKKESAAVIADAIVGEYQYPLRITGTTAKTIAGAINELKNLVDLLPQFAIEVVQTLPVSDISTTTIYLVPTQDPEQGNYYEEYIYVNNAWELVGTTAVDLSGYYTSAQVDTLLAAKADSASLATVATSGAYSDLSGKPTIDTALDTTSTNAVENRAVASEINSIKSDITVDGSASGDIASFVDGSANPLKELKISIVAQQSGSGDPSPTNVRPITGWTGAKVSRTSINVWDEEWELGGISDTTGANWSASDRIRSKNYISILPNTQYYWKSSAAFGVIAYYDADKNFISAIVNTSRDTVKTSPEGAYYVRFQEISAYGTTYNNDISINYPATDTAYHAHSGETIIIILDWQSVAGTVGNGTIAPLTGALAVTAIVKKFRDMRWTKPSSTDHTKFYASFTPNYDNRRGNNFKCSMLKNDGIGSSGTFYGSENTFRYWNARTTSEIYVKTDTEYASIEDFLAVFGDADFYYELATPVTYQLTPTEIRSLLGLNNVWADCGAITELKYTRDLNLCINDIISRIEALEGGSSNRSLSVSPVLTKSLTSDSDKTESKTEEETEEETKEEAQNER